MSDQRFQHEAGFQLASFKAAGDGEPAGEFEAIVSVFGNVDLGGDRIAPGAFSKSLAEWQATGDPIPVIWNHMWDNPDAHIGAIDPADAVETAAGLQVKGRIDLDNPLAAQVYRLLSQRRVKEFSFGYNVRDSRVEKGVNELLDLDVIEVGPTLKGMNPATELLAVKALAAVTEATDAAVEEVAEAAAVEEVAEAAAYLVGESGSESKFKAGARLSKATRSTLEQVVDQLSSLLVADRNGDDEQETKSTEAETIGKASDPDLDLMTRIKLLKEK